MHLKPLAQRLAYNKYSIDAQCYTCAVLKNYMSESPGISGCCTKPVRSAQPSLCKLPGLGSLGSVNIRETQLALTGSPASSLLSREVAT